MAKANQYHRGGHTFRHTTSVKIPIKERRKNMEKWKDKKRKVIQKARLEQKRGGWFKKKLGRNKE